MITDSNNITDLYDKSCSNTDVQRSEIYDLIHLLLKNWKETDDNVHSLQKAIAGLREQFQDSRVEHSEDSADIKRQLSELRRNKVWISREAV